MIEKKVGNVTLRMNKQSKMIDVMIGTWFARYVNPCSDPAGLGPEVAAAIEDLRKPLAENECWGPDGCRLQFELCDADGVGIAVQNDDTVLVEGAGQALLKFKSAYDALRIWSEKERGRWDFVRDIDHEDEPYIAIRFNGVRGYGTFESKGFDICEKSSRQIPAWVQAKAQAEYEEMVMDRKPKKPSERLKAPADGVDRELWDKMLSVLDELAEKVGGL